MIVIYGLVTAYKRVNEKSESQPCFDQLQLVHRFVSVSEADRRA